MQNWQIFSVCHYFVKQSVSYVLCCKDSCLEISFFSNLHADVSVVFWAYPLWSSEIAGPNFADLTQFSVPIVLVIPGRPIQNINNKESTLVQIMAWCHQATEAITWANVDPDLCYHMASLGHSDFILYRLFRSTSVFIRYIAFPEGKWVHNIIWSHKWYLCSASLIVSATFLQVGVTFWNDMVERKYQTFKISCCRQRWRWSWIWEI